MEILLVNKAISILVNHVESFLELLDLGLIKHSEYIGSRPLGTLLGSLRLGLFAGHGGGMKGACACVCLCASPVICAVCLVSGVLSSVCRLLLRGENHCLRGGRLRI